MIAAKVSMHIGKKYSVKHNLRDYDVEKWNRDGHIETERSGLNVTLTHTDLKKFFEATFGEAIKAFNKKNEEKHPERCMTLEDYYKEQKGKVQECILQLGDHEEYMELVEQIGQEKADELHLNFLTKAFEKWKEDNPTLRVFSAVIHMDETKHGTPHLHLDFLPVAEASRGLTVKVSMDGALKALKKADGQNFTREKKHAYSETPYKQWLRDRRKAFEALADKVTGKLMAILPSEKSVTGHTQPEQHRAEQKLIKTALSKVSDALQGKGKQKEQAVNWILEHADATVKALQQEAEQANKKANEQANIAQQAVEKAKREQEEAEQLNAEAKRLNAEARSREQKAIERERAASRKFAEANSYINETAARMIEQLKRIPAIREAIEAVQPTGAFRDMFPKNYDTRNRQKQKPPKQEQQKGALNK